MSEVDVKEDVWKLLNALVALAPSRNYTTLYIHMMPMDYPSAYDMFPEFLSLPEMRESLAKIFGIAYGANVDVTYDGVATQLKSFMERIFSFFENPDIRTRLSALTGVSDDAIPNPRREWVEIRLKGVKSIPSQGRHVTKILRFILESLEPVEGWRSFHDLLRLSQLKEKEVRQIIDLSLKYRLIVRDDRSGKEGYRLAEDFRRYQETLREMLVESESS